MSTQISAVNLFAQKKYTSWKIKEVLATSSKYKQNHDKVKSSFKKKIPPRQPAHHPS